MAKQTDGINGGYRGKVGSVVGYMWRGQWCLRAAPRFFHDAKTDLQLAQRSFFKASVAYAGKVKAVLRVGLYMPSLVAHKTECNYFIMINKRCLAWDGEGLAVDYENLRVSEGPVAPVAFGEPELLDDTTLTIPFEKNPEHRRSNADDKVYVAAFCASTGEAVLSVPAYRRMKSVTVMLPDVWAGQEVHLYGFVQDNAGRTSDSVYIGNGLLDYQPEPELIVEFDGVEEMSETGTEEEKGIVGVDGPADLPDNVVRQEEKEGGGADGG